MFARTTLTAALIASLTLLGACSDDDKDPEADPSPTATESGEQVGAKTRNCKVTADVTGAATATWKGKGRVITGNDSGPKAIYQFVSKNDSLSVYSTGEGFEPSAVATVDDATYSTQAGASGLDVSTKGKTATVDADALGVDGETQVHVTASFDC